MEHSCRASLIVLVLCTAPHLLRAQAPAAIKWACTSLAPSWAARCRISARLSDQASAETVPMRNARRLSDKAAYGIGIVMAPLLAYEQVGLDLLWTGLIGGSAAYGLHRLREALR